MLPENEKRKNSEAGAFLFTCVNTIIGCLIGKYGRLAMALSG
jgi:hypothetical protein